jgi:hypothetical protein
MGTPKQLETAQSLFDSMVAFGDAPEVVLERIEAAFSLVLSHDRAKRLEEAQSFFLIVCTPFGRSL